MIFDIPQVRIRNGETRPHAAAHLIGGREFSSRDPSRMGTDVKEAEETGAAKTGALLGDGSQCARLLNENGRTLNGEDESDGRPQFIHVQSI